MGNATGAHDPSVADYRATSPRSRAGRKVTLRMATGGRSGRQLLDGGSVAGKGRAAHVAHLVAVEAARPMHRGPIVPDDEIVLLPGVRMDELALRGVFGQVA